MFSDEKGTMYSHPHLRMAAAGLETLAVPREDELIRLPRGSTLFYLPRRVPVGYDLSRRSFQPLTEFEGRPVWAVGAFLIPAYLRLYNPAALAKDKSILPLWAYTAAGASGGSFFVTARRVDPRIRQSPHFYDNVQVAKNVRKFLAQSPKNRLYKHLANCALNHNCLAAKNFFLARWEAPLPTAQACNARCLGCLSYQPEADCVASHARINFRPEVSEMAELLTRHLSVAREAVVSFGQGCEGEPLSEAAPIARAVALVRKSISRGTINMNTNGSLPGKVKLLCEAGIDSFRFSLSSPVEKFYNLYFRPRGYAFSDVLRSIAIAKRFGKFVSINLFVFPGFTDSRPQALALERFISDTGIDMIQWRNLNIDPEHYRSVLSYKDDASGSLSALLRTIRKKFPALKMGYFNLPKEKFDTFKNVVK